MIGHLLGLCWGYRSTHDGESISCGALIIGDMGTMENNMEATILGYVRHILGLYRD